jgi:Schlafen, AlbA_2
VAGARVKVLSEEKGLEVVGYGQVAIDGYAQCGGPIEILGPASIASLTRALTDARFYYHSSLWITEQPAAQFSDPDYAPHEDVDLHVNDGVLTACGAFWREDSTEPDFEDVEQIITPFLTRCGAELDTAFSDEQGGSYLMYIFIRFTNPRGKTVGDLYRVAKDMLELLRTADGAPLRRATALDLLRAARVDLLLGQPECQWLDAKRAPYAATDTGRFELAKDAAAFANSGGGIIVIGVSSVRRHDRDVLAAVHPFPFALARPSSYRQILDHRIHPPVQGLEVFHVSYGVVGSGLAVISVPPQPEEIQPFLVRGAIVERRFRGSYFSLVTRRGEDTLATDAAAIHSLLVAGRVALRGERRKQT